MFFEKKDDDIGPFYGAIEAPILDFCDFSQSRSLPCLRVSLPVCVIDVTKNTLAFKCQW